MRSANRRLLPTSHVVTYIIPSTRSFTSIRRLFKICVDVVAFESLGRQKINLNTYITVNDSLVLRKKKKTTISKSDETPTIAKQLLCSMHALLLVNAKLRSTIYKQIFVAILQTALHFIEVNDHLRVFDIQNDGVITLDDKRRSSSDLIKIPNHFFPVSCLILMDQSKLQKYLYHTNYTFSSIPENILFLNVSCSF